MFDVRKQSILIISQNIMVRESLQAFVSKSSAICNKCSFLPRTGHNTSRKNVCVVSSSRKKSLQHPKTAEYSMMYPGNLMYPVVSKFDVSRLFYSGTFREHKVLSSNVTYY